MISKTLFLNNSKQLTQYLRDIPKAQIIPIIERALMQNGVADYSIEVKHQFGPFPGETGEKTIPTFDVRLENGERQEVTMFVKQTSDGNERTHFQCSAKLGLPIPEFYGFLTEDHKNTVFMEFLRDEPLDYSDRDQVIDTVDLLAKVNSVPLPASYRRRESRELAYHHSTKWHQRFDDFWAAATNGKLGPKYRNECEPFVERLMHNYIDLIRRKIEIMQLGFSIQGTGAIGRRRVTNELVYFDLGSCRHSIRFLNFASLRLRFEESWRSPRPLGDIELATRFMERFQTNTNQRFSLDAFHSEVGWAERMWRLDKFLCNFVYYSSVLRQATDKPYVCLPSYVLRSFRSLVDFAEKDLMCRRWRKARPEFSIGSKRRRDSKAALNGRTLLVIIGAPRSGTTVLWRHLQKHHQIAKSTLKDPDFFSKKLAGRRGLERYFIGRGSNDGSAEVLVDGSVSYSKYPFFSEVPERIRILPGRKRFIYLLRHPADRMESEFAQAVAMQWLSLEEFRDGVRGEKRDEFFYKGLLESNYTSQLERYLLNFRRDQILLLSFDELVKEPESVMKTIYDWLDIDEPEDLIASKSPIRSRKFRHGSEEVLLDYETCSYLMAKLRPSIARLQDEFGFKCKQWLDSLTPQERRETRETN